MHRLRPSHLLWLSAALFVLSLGLPPLPWWACLVPLAPFAAVLAVLVALCIHWALCDVVDAIRARRALRRSPSPHTPVLP